jgi:3-oxoacyl-[acyl-carrier protein] reductase
MGQLDGKTVVVTGGGHGIGRAYSERFSREGARVVVAELDEAAARDVADNIERAGGEALAMPTDVASWSSAQAMAERAVERFGGIDGLVNNAAIFSTIPIARVGFEQIDEGEWDRVMEVNVKGVWLCCRAVVPAMRRRGGGSIVNIASGTVFNGTPTRVHYVASKAAVVGITRVLSRELGGDNIRVNAIAPGNTLSEENPSPEILRMREAAVPARSLKRVQRPDDIVGSVLFMLSDDAAFITGQTLLVDGGTALH